MTVSLPGLKRFVREYAVALLATLLLLCVLAILLVSRYYALARLDDLSKINPLINVGKSQLVGRDKITGATADQQTSDSSASSNTATKPAPQQSSTNSSTQTTAPSSGQGTQSSTSGNSSSQAPPFAASIDTMTQVAGSPSGLGKLNPICTITHQFTATIQGTNGPGTVAYTWMQSNGTNSAVQNQAFSSGASDEQVTYQWTITAATGDYWVKLAISSPNQTDKTLNFKHQCVL